jgi:hypothetical protein
VEAIMSAPLKIEDGVDDPLLHLPRWVPQSFPVVPEPSTLTTAPPVVPEITNSPPMAPGIGSPNLDLPPPRLRPFAGDIAANDMPGRWRLDQDFDRQLPTRTTRRTLGQGINGLAFVVILSAIIVLCGAILLTFVGEERKHAADVVGMVTPPLEGVSRSGRPAQSARLLIQSKKGFTNESLPLGVSLTHASGGETVTLAGLAPGTILSVGTPLGLSGWQVPAREIGNAFVHAPKDFVGIMDVAIDLHSAGDWLLDSRVIRFEWMPGKAAPLTSQLGPR